MIRTLFVCSVALTALAGCAAHKATTRTLADRLVHGKPEATARPPAPRPNLDQWIAKMREVQANARPDPRPAILTAEKLDPKLGEAVARATTFPSSPNHVAAAVAYYRAGILDAAQDQIAEAVRLDRYDGAAYDLRARIWRDWDLPGTAIGDAHRAVYYSPRSPEARNTLGTVLLALGRTADARAAYLKATEIDSRAAYAWSNVCHVSLLEGDLLGGEKACRRALEVDPDLAAARQNLDRIHALISAAAVPGVGQR